jgi:hypothetical protein
MMILSLLYLRSGGGERGVSHRFPAPSYFIPTNDLQITIDNDTGFVV